MELRELQEREEDRRVEAEELAGGGRGTAFPSDTVVHGLHREEVSGGGGGTVSFVLSFEQLNESETMLEIPRDLATSARALFIYISPTALEQDTGKNA